MVRRVTFFIVQLIAVAWTFSSPWVNQSTSVLESSFGPQDHNGRKGIIWLNTTDIYKTNTFSNNVGSVIKFRVKRGNSSSSTTTMPISTTDSVDSVTKKPNFLLVKDFETFKKTYKKSYKRQFREFRSKIAFEQNKNLVVQQEKDYKEGRSSFRCATNVMSDLSQVEYLMRYVRMTSNHFNSILDGDHLVSAPIVDPKEVPDELDWRKSGFVTPPDNQKSCGSCYAFSIARSIEGNS